MSSPIYLQNCIDDIYNELLDLAHDERSLRIQEKVISVALTKLEPLMVGAELDERYIHKLQFIDKRLSELSNQHIFTKELKMGTVPLAAVHSMVSSAKAASSPLASAASASEESLDVIYARIGSKYGNKTANLMRLESVLATTGVIVPEFKGLSEDAIKSFLFKAFPEMEALWAKFLSDGAKPNSLYLKQIQQGILLAFSSHDFPKDDFLKSFIDAGRPLMVRSTGKEDSIEVSNPGGNESLSNVLPNKEKIKEAIGLVLSSYFSEKSLQQRLFSGDDIRVFPPLPVLIQTMVSETADSIPISGVIFTRESEHNTKGIVQISASFGHAEGVVTGSSPTDLFYVTEVSIHSIVSRKLYRKAPKASGGLETRENPKESQMTPALNERLCRQLFDCAKRIELSYGMPMDIEWSYDPKTDHLYVFQARPIPKKPPTEASFIKEDKLSLLQHLQRCHLINSCGGATLEVDAKSSLFAKTAPEVLSQYLAAKVKPRICFIASPTAVNSHEAAFLRSQGVALVYLSPQAFSQAATLFKTQKALIDTQSSVFGFLAPGQKGSDYIEIGLKHFIAPHEESLPITKVKQEDMDRFLADLKIEATEVDLEAFKIELKTLTGFNALEKLCNAIEKTADDKKRAATILLFVTILDKKILNCVDDSAVKEFRLKLLFNLQKLHSVYKETSSNVMDKKFAMHWVRSQVLDTPSSDCIFSDSLMSILARHKEKKILAIDVRDTSSGFDVAEYRDLLARSSKFILNKEHRAAFLFLVKSLNKKELEILAKFYGTIGSSNIEVAVNAVFSPIFGKSETEILAAKEGLIAQVLLSLQDPSIKADMALQKTLLESVEKFSTRSLDFGRRELFDQRLTELKEEFMPKALMCISRLEELSSIKPSTVASSISHMMMSHVFNQMVTTFDDCIKGLTSSSEYGASDNELKIKRLISILQEYQTFTVRAMSDKIIGHDPDLKRHADVLKSFLLSHLRYLAISCEREGYPQQMLEASKAFSVQSSALGSGVKAPDRNPPRSLEDYFTTLHQSLLVCASSNQLTQQIRLKIEDFPKEVRVLNDMIMSLNLESGPSGSIKNPAIQSILWQYPTFKISYNAPLANHSALFEICGELQPNGDLKSLKLNGHIFASFNRAGLAMRDEHLNRYIFECYEMGLPPSSDATYEFKKDTAFFSYDLLKYKESESLSKTCEIFSLFLDNIIQFLQNFRPLPDLELGHGVVSKHPSLINAYEGQLYNGFGLLIIDAFFKTILADLSADNVQLFLDYANYSRNKRNHIFKGDIQTNYYLILEQILSNDEILASFGEKELRKIISMLNDLHPDVPGFSGITNPPFTIDQKLKIKHFISFILPLLNFYNYGKSNPDIRVFSKKYGAFINQVRTENKAKKIAEKSPQLLALIEASSKLSIQEKAFLSSQVNHLATLEEEPLLTIQAIEKIHPNLRFVVLTSLLAKDVDLSFISMQEILSSDLLTFDMRLNLDKELNFNRAAEPASPLGQLYLASLEIAKEPSVLAMDTLRESIWHFSDDDMALFIKILNALHDVDTSSFTFTELTEDPLKVANALRSLIIIKGLANPGMLDSSKELSFVKDSVFFDGKYLKTKKLSQIVIRWPEFL